MTPTADSKIHSSVIEIDEETGEAFVTLPEGLLAETGWKPGDTLVWEIHEDGTVTLSKAAA